MAFVQRSEKHFEVRGSTSSLIGPGSYLQHLSYSLPRSFVPFNSKEERSGKKQKEVTPGPGAYQIEKPGLTEKVVVSSANEDIKIIEVPKPQSNFKSASKRFEATLKENVENPGPGQYEAFEPLKRIIEKGNAHKQRAQKQNVIETLMKMNKYQSTPSIPSKSQTYGYTENDNNDLALNKMPGQQYGGLMADSVGPGQYELKDCFKTSKNKGSSWHKYKEIRMKQSKASSLTPVVGPGTYDVQHSGNTLPLYKMKQSAGFASRTVRSMDGKRNAVNIQKKARMNQDEEDDSEDELVEDSMPGPGAYHNDKQSLIKLSKANSYGNFGSLSKRFSATAGLFGNPIGPGEYNPMLGGLIGKNPHEVKVRNPPFLSSDTRFIVTKIEEVKPGPGAYEPRINLEDKLIQKIQKGYRGNFGSTERRFKANSDSEEPGPGAYISNVKKVDEDEENIIIPSAVFKSDSKRAVFHGGKGQQPPVGSYKLDYYDINKQVNEEPEDPDLKIRVPGLGFSTSQPRFKEISNYPKRGNEIEEEDNEEELKVIKDQQNEDKKLKQSKHFLSKAERFNYKNKGQNPAPGQYYDSNSNTWNKRTFNIHFADF